MARLQWRCLVRDRKLPKTGEFTLRLIDNLRGTRESRDLRITLALAVRNHSKDTA